MTARIDIVIVIDAVNCSMELSRDEIEAPNVKLNWQDVADRKDHQDPGSGPIVGLSTQLAAHLVLIGDEEGEIDHLDADNQVGH